MLCPMHLLFNFGNKLILDLFFKILLFAFLLLFSIATFHPYFLQVGLLLQYVAPFQSVI